MQLKIPFFLIVTFLFLSSLTSLLIVLFISEQGKEIRNTIYIVIILFITVVFFFQGIKVLRRLKRVSMCEELVRLRRSTVLIVGSGIFNITLLLSFIAYAVTIRADVWLIATFVRCISLLIISLLRILVIIPSFFLFVTLDQAFSVERTNKTKSIAATVAMKNWAESGVSGKIGEDKKNEESGNE